MNKFAKHKRPGETLIIFPDQDNILEWEFGGDLVPVEAHREVSNAEEIDFEEVQTVHPYPYRVPMSVVIDWRMLGGSLERFALGAISGSVMVLRAAGMILEAGVKLMFFLASVVLWFVSLLRMPKARPFDDVGQTSSSTEEETIIFFYHHKKTQS